MLMLFIILILTLIALLIKKRLNFWRDRGIPTPQSIFEVTWKSITQSSSENELWRKVYAESKSLGQQECGTYMFTSPIYVPINTEIVKRIMQVDFQHFVGRGMYVNEKGDPLSANLFNLDGPKWKNLRHKLTPTFTSGKMKMMFETLLNCTAGLCEAIDSGSRKGVDIKDILARFTTDIIGSCAYGIECNTLKDPDSEFRRKGTAFFQNNLIENLRNLFVFMSPKLMLSLNIKSINTDVTQFFTDVVKDVVAHREKNKISRNDFLQLLIQLKNSGDLTDDGKIHDKNSKKNDTSLTIEEISAQVFVFFLAGFETSSTTMTYCLYELAKNQNVQDKVREEMKRLYQKYDGKLTYEAVSEMHYLEQVINETLRKYPPLPVLTRVCTEDYQITGSGLLLTKGTKIVIPIVGIHYDPEFYPEPEKFDPERFTEENKRTRPPFTFIPFGEGPRICIGLRFGMMQTKVGLTSILLNFKVTVSSKTKEPLQYDPTSSVTSTRGGMWLDFEKISQKIVKLCAIRS